MNLKSAVTLQLLLGLLGAALVATARADEKVPTTVKPEARPGKPWTDRDASFNERVKKGDVDLLFIGDSITQGWEGAGKDAWDKYYSKRKAVNLGIGGDRTQHVLWRLDHGNIDGISPKLAVLMIGTNNSNGEDNTAEEIGEGIEAIVKKLRAKLPQTKVLVLGIFPRGVTPNPQREKNAKASAISAKSADSQMVTYLDIGDKFLTPDGTLTKEIMPDALHLSPQGYEIWAAAIEPKVQELMNGK
jgi:lysophospholipase L1-like esterase